MERGISPTLRLWQLAESLRGHRERAKLTIEEAAGRLKPHSSRTLVGLEQAATTVRQFELALVPGLLQTSDYARALMTTLAPTTSIEVLENRVAARMIRQHVLSGAEPLTLEAILSEAVLRYPVGGKRVMRGQLERLLELTSAPNRHPSGAVRGQPASRHGRRVYPRHAARVGA